MYDCGQISYSSDKISGYVNENEISSLSRKAIETETGQLRERSEIELRDSIQPPYPQQHENSDDTDQQNIIINNVLNKWKKNNKNQSAISSPYEKLNVGLVMVLIQRLSGSARTAVITAISINIIISSSDTASDLSLVYFYANQGLISVAAIVLIADYLPGLLVLSHQISNDSWKSHSLKKKVYTILSVGFHPFSLMTTNLTWLCNISSQRCHRVARLSAILHSGIEAPLQFIILLYAYSKSILPLPWMESTNIVDENGNVLPLGKISLFSLALTSIGLLNAAIQTFQMPTKIEQLWSTIYALTNLLFRILSITFLAIYFGIFSTPVFILVIAANYLVLLRHNETNGKWNSIITSLGISLFLPACVSRSPERFQIKDERQSEDNACTKVLDEEKVSRRNVSFWISITSNPVLFVGDFAAYCCLCYTEFVQDNVWSNPQLIHIFLFLLSPLFVLSMIVSFSFSHTLESGNKTRDYWQQMKKIMAGISFIGLITSAVIYGIMVDKLNRTALVFVNENNELAILQVVSKGKLSGCEYGIVDKCDKLILSDSNFRVIDMEPGVAYIDRKPNDKVDVNRINANTTIFYNFLGLQNLGVQAVEKLMSINSHCKKCVLDSNTCNKLLTEIEDKPYCKGTVTSVKKA